MHIPDGYLSPSTCAVMYGGALPFWWVALRRVKAMVRTRLAPLISIFAALAFVIMMFNVPVPGGTTAHAVGMGIATIVIGPWASMLSISIALVMQALFFGDGGLTTLGANCFNMAIIGSLVAYLVYRALAGRASIASSRRVVAAALAGYIAINASALCASIELGLQPLLFKSAAGAPLYAPYPLSIAVPAMMIGHLTLAGLAELIITGGAVAYLQRANPALLTQTAPSARRDENSAPEFAGRKTARTIRLLWTAIALLLVLTPLGILAAGAAWGEWSARDFSSPAMRAKIMAVSGSVAPPAQAPRGLARWSSIWTAPFPNYSPSFVRSRGLGYMLSAMFGVGAISLISLFISRLAARIRPAPPETEEA